MHLPKNRSASVLFLSDGGWIGFNWKECDWNLVKYFYINIWITKSLTRKSNPVSSVFTNLLQIGRSSAKYPPYLYTHTPSFIAYLWYMYLRSYESKRGQNLIAYLFFLVNICFKYKLTFDNISYIPYNIAGVWVVFRFFRFTLLYYCTNPTKVSVLRINIKILINLFTHLFTFKS